MLRGLGVCMCWAASAQLIGPCYVSTKIFTHTFSNALFSIFTPAYICKKTCVTHWRGSGMVFVEQQLLVDCARV